MNKNNMIYDEMSSKDVIYTIGNMVIGFGVLTLPTVIVKTTVSSDGWISILLGGAAAMLLAWTIGRLLERYPGHNVHDIATKAINRQVAHFFTLCFAIYFLLFVSYQLRGVATVARLYLFDNTPEEIIGFFFLLLLAYGVAGESIALVRLNLLYFPIVIIILMILVLLTVGSFNIHKLLPVFKSDFTGILEASKETIFSYLGVEIMLFYNIYVLKKIKLASSMLRGIVVPTIVYLILFVFVIAVFGALVVENTLYPIAELAKEVQVPGEVFERFEFFFFLIWVISLFCTNVMALDVGVLALQAVFPKPKKTTILIILLPVMYVLSLLPKGIQELQELGNWISYAGMGIAWGIPILLLLIIKLRGGERRES